MAGSLNGLLMSPINALAGFGRGGIGGGIKGALAGLLAGGVVMFAPNLLAPLHDQPWVKKLADKAGEGIVPLLMYLVPGGALIGAVAGGAISMVKSVFNGFRGQADTPADAPPQGGMLSGVGGLLAMGAVATVVVGAVLKHNDVRLAPAGDGETPRPGPAPAAARATTPVRVVLPV